MGLHGILDSKTYAQTHIGLHRGVDLHHRILRAHHQMHAKRTTERGHAKQSVHIAGQLFIEHMEFVDDNHESCRCIR